MKIKTFITTLSFLIIFPSLGFAKNELVMQKKVLNWASMGIGDNVCMELITIKEGRNVPDMRKEQCGSIDGKYSMTLSGPPGTTVTFFGKFGYQKGNGFLTIKKTDHKMLWLLDLAAFPAGQWHTTEASEDSGAFEAFYNATPIFDQSIYSVKWGNHVE